MLLLLDSDSICYSNAFSVQSSHGEDAELIPGAHKVLCRQLDDKIEEIYEDAPCHDFKLFLTGKGNFREKEYSSYKANRKDMHRPVLLQEARKYLIDMYDAVLVQGMEADDAVCIEQTFCYNNGMSSIIGHLDKDIDQQPGEHYRWAYRGKPSERYYLNPVDACRKLYIQALTGDKVDNIMYEFKEDTQTFRKAYGIGVSKARKLLNPLDNEKDFYDVVLQQYLEWGKTEKDLEDNMHQLFLIRKLHPRTGEPVRWRKPC